MGIVEADIYLKEFVMRRLRTLPIALALFAMLGASLTACASTAVEVSSGAVIIDVRTPAEYAEGHLDGAVNIDVQSGFFEQEVTSLPLDRDYFVYCKSGNRSAQAVALMDSFAFDTVTDLGSMQDAAKATSVPIVAG